MTASELKLKLDNKEPFVVIDVREQWEFEEVNIGARNIPLHDLPKSLDDLQELKNTSFVVHCRTGKRSIQAQKYLIKNGFNEVINLEGGIEAYLQL